MASILKLSRRLPEPAPDATCLVTGASSGIGSEIARALARRGHGVTLVARRKERLEALAAVLREEHGVRVETLACDVSDPVAREWLVADVSELALTVDLLVNCAGFGTGGRFHTLDAGREVEMVRLNCEAIVALCGAFVPAMAERGRGAVLNVASTIGFQPVPGEATYGATKAFALSFSEALRSDLVGTGVTVTALCPGPVRTEFMDGPGIEAGASRLPGPMWVDAAAVAEQGVRGLDRGRRTVIPGVMNRAGAFAGRHTHRGLLMAVGRKIAA
jgi:hypothetical protein